MILKKSKSYLKSVISFLLILTISMQTVYISYASVPVNIATDSNAMDISIYSMDSMSMENEISTLSMAGGAMTAVRWLWALILSLCGVSVSDVGGIDSIASAISDWVSKAGQPNEYAQLIIEIEKASWASKFTKLKECVAMVKAWLKEKAGYGTDTGIENIPVSIAPSVSNSYSAKYGYNIASDTKIPSTAVYFNSHTYFQSGDPSYNAETDFFIDFSSGFRIAKFYNSNYLSLKAYDSVNKKIISFNGLYYIQFKNKGYYYTSNDSWFRCDASNFNAVINACPFPVYETLDQMNAYLKNGVVGVPINSWSPDKTDIENIPVISKPQIQQSDLDAAGDLTLPADSDIAQTVYDGASLAADTAALIEALKDYVSVNYKIQLTPEQVYNHLSYVVISLANSFGVVIDNSVVDDFIRSFYGDYVNGSSAEKLEQASEISNQFIIINGGNNPNDDKNSNKYRVAG